MSAILSQVSYQVFLYCVFMFFIMVSVFAFIVGISITMRNATMLRLFEFMNRSVSVRKAMRPLSLPHFIEPILLKHPSQLGLAIIVGATISIYLLSTIDERNLQPIFLGPFSYFSALALADYTKTFLMVGNVLCIGIGLLMRYYPHHLSRIEAYTDRWYSVRKRTHSLEYRHHGVDLWVLSHPTISGIALSLMSLGLFISMYPYILVT